MKVPGGKDGNSNSGVLTELQRTVDLMADGAMKLISRFHRMDDPAVCFSPYKSQGLWENGLFAKHFSLIWLSYLLPLRHFTAHKHSERWTE